MIRLPNRVLLDTNFMIDLQLRNTVAVELFLSFKKYHLVVSSITYLEVAVGEFNSDPRQEQSLKRLFQGFEILPFSLEATLLAGRLATRMGPKALDMGNDIAIASTGIVENRTVLTHNIQDFRRIPGVKALDWFEL